MEAVLWQPGEQTQNTQWFWLHFLRFQEENDDYNAILVKSLADRLAEVSVFMFCV